MTIRAGEDWGEPYRPTGDEPEARTDAEVVAAHRAGTAPALVRGGDLYRTLGGRPAPEPLRLPIDLLEVAVDGGRFLAAAHVVVRNRWWSGRCAVVMNAAWLGEWYLGPRAHPDDGVADITVGALGPRDRLRARRRAPSGSHVPHPALTVRRTGQAELHFERPTAVWVDGIPAGRTTRLQVRVLPDATSVVL